MSHYQFAALCLLVVVVYVVTEVRLRAHIAIRRRERLAGIACAMADQFGATGAAKLNSATAALTTLEPSLSQQQARIYIEAHLAGRVA